uniref:Uncharacterized protein n=1 Tax=Bos indicus x Bos taurus TaxID=30522 RepID=A0A4W2DQH5_BOBOX
MKEKSEKVCFKLNIQKYKIIASSPITSWQIDGETVGTVADFIFGGSKITGEHLSGNNYKNPGEKLIKKNRNFDEMPKFEMNCDQEHMNLATNSTIGGSILQKQGNCS